MYSYFKQHVGQFKIKVAKMAGLRTTSCLPEVSEWLCYLSPQNELRMSLHCN